MSQSLNLIPINGNLQQTDNEIQDEKAKNLKGNASGSTNNSQSSITQSILAYTNSVAYLTSDTAEITEEPSDTTNSSSGSITNPAGLTENVFLMTSRLCQDAENSNNKIQMAETSKMNALNSDYVRQSDSYEATAQKLSEKDHHSGFSLFTSIVMTVCMVTLVAVGGALAGPVGAMIAVTLEMALLPAVDSTFWQDMGSGYKGGHGYDTALSDSEVGVINGQLSVIQSHEQTTQNDINNIASTDFDILNSSNQQLGSTINSSNQAFGTMVAKN